MVKKKNPSIIGRKLINYLILLKIRVKVCFNRMFEIQWNIMKLNQVWHHYIQKKKGLKTETFNFLAENEGFEPPVPLGTIVFKTTAIDHSANSPWQK